MYVNVDSLPEIVKNALMGAKFHKSDIEVIHVDSVSMGNSAYGDGYQAFTTLVDMNDNRVEHHKGSWGGANMFNRDNAVDLDDRLFPLQIGHIVIKGQRGGTTPVSAQIYAHRDSSILPLISGNALEEDELYVLSIYRGIKGGYRKEYLDRLKGNADITDKLVESGHLKRNKAGSTQITTEGKNAVGNRSYYEFQHVTGRSY